MLQYFVCRISLQWIDLQHPRNQFFCRIRNVVPIWRVEFEETAQDLIEQLLLIIRSGREGWEADQQNVHYDTGGPDVHFHAIASLSQDLGSHIGGGAAHCEQWFRYQLGQPEIAQFQRFFGIATFILSVLGEIYHLQTIRK